MAKEVMKLRIPRKENYLCISSDCHNKMPYIRWLKEQNIYFFTIPEAEKPQIKVQQDLGFGSLPDLETVPPLTVFSHIKGRGHFLVSFLIRAVILSNQGSNLMTSF